MSVIYKIFYDFIVCFGKVISASLNGFLLLQINDLLFNKTLNTYSIH